jgi:GxxExxY protein
MEKEIRDEQTYAIIGAAMEVHRVLGCGFLEHVYHEALREEFRLRDIPFVHEVPLPIIYKSKRLEMIYKADLVCFGNVLVELKALAQLSGVEHAQIINYLKATPMKCGLLINFGAQQLQQQRFIHTHPTTKS